MDAYLNRDDYWMFDNIPSVKDLDEFELERRIALVSDEIDEYCNTSPTFAVNLTHTSQTLAIQ